ncbi:complex I subunit 4 family protein [Rickettsia endosymbiont of Cardiosporidium cionae]|uniref:complex I subunit 4 family protein n=1 Tax=Rickettsia endosymbiont of Cardiosporidium cionae TaxID=2777155 RepID=UPI001893C89B|nr:NADH-quinone oxidoreductase subunit M [Rickettsia endosymbiont of Cardiosporidium cionae]KAF8818907.1 NADH-quinone oxidoreductase subunit M [Rickettsia endosymbiont of Cardiosporidium cionae]
MTDLPILSITILIPIVSAAYIGVFISQSKSRNRETYAIYVTILSNILTLITTIYLLIKFDFKETTYQFVEKYTWINSIGLDFYIGIDGLSIFFVFLTALLTLISVVFSLFVSRQYIKEFLLCFLVLESFCIGTFVSLNLLLFYIFFEILLIPMYLIIGIWGGENRVYAAKKFFIYSFFGSIFLLFSIICLYIKTNSLNIPELYILAPNLSIHLQSVLWSAMFLSFAIKIPIFPLHTWLSDAHVEAPTEGSIMLAGILLKIGGYAMIRILLPIFFKVSLGLGNVLLWISAFTIVYAALIAIHQSDMKKMIAYSSIVHMGYVTGGIFSFNERAITGAIFQMISHTIISASLFLIIGILYVRGGSKKITAYGGVANSMPVLATLFMVVTLASIGLPGLSGFIGEFLIILGMYEENNIAAIVSAIGIILTAIYMLNLYRKLMLATDNQHQFPDLYRNEQFALISLTILILLIGICPNIILKFIKNSVIILLNMNEIL